MATLTAGIASFNASAQSSAADFATRIKTEFGNIYKNGRVGNDWCFNVETEPGYTWWYYQLSTDNNLTARKIRQTARIQATYKVDTENFRRYSSIFLGLDVPDSISFTAFDLNSFPVVKKDQYKKADDNKPAAKIAANPDPNVLQEPDPTVSNCNLSDFLIAYFLPYNVTLGDLSNTVMDPGSQAYANARYWTFAGRAHAVQNVGSYPISIVVNNVATPVRLIVGFGGGGGP
jgi:hypothetical protein